MSEPEKSDGDDGIEALLRESLQSAPPPGLTTTFTERVTARLRPRRLAPGARRTLRLYVLAAAALSVGGMIALEVPWPLIVLALALPAALALLLRRRLR